MGGGLFSATKRFGITPVNVQNGLRTAAIMSERYIDA